jgi:UDP-2-acetamido-3-amino-2,3-dideoxy-glucuronate N-acetyltransferase
MTLKPGIIDLPNIIDPRGNLTAGEFGRSIPFEAKRYFIVYQVPLVKMRGEHAHWKCHQFLICVRGRMTVSTDDGTERKEYLLDRPDRGLYIPPKVWGAQFDHSPDAALLVFASEYYDAQDYIRDYDDFLKEVTPHRGAGPRN